MHPLLLADPKIMCLGLIQSLFEGSMFMFVLEWTPALTREAIPHGYIFAAFMVRNVRELSIAIIKPVKGAFLWLHVYNFDSFLDS